MGVITMFIPDRGKLQELQELHIHDNIAEVVGIFDIGNGWKAKLHLQLFANKQLPIVSFTDLKQYNFEKLRTVSVQILQAGYGEPYEYFRELAEEFLRTHADIVQEENETEEAFVWLSEVPDAYPYSFWLFNEEIPLSLLDADIGEIEQILNYNIRGNKIHAEVILDIGNGWKVKTTLVLTTEITYSDIENILYHQKFSKILLRNFEVLQRNHNKPLSSFFISYFRHAVKKVTSMV